MSRSNFTKGWSVHTAKATVDRQSKLTNRLEAEEPLALELFGRQVVANDNDWTNREKSWDDPDDGSGGSKNVGSNASKNRSE